jgi:hypothetical protein
MNSYHRKGFKWSINEILSLQREFELLGWDIDQISNKHERTPYAIMYKLGQEGFADFNVLYDNYKLNSPIPDLNTNTHANDLELCSSNYDIENKKDENYFDEGQEEGEEEEIKLE